MIPEATNGSRGDVREHALMVRGKGAALVPPLQRVDPPFGSLVAEHAPASFATSGQSRASREPFDGGAEAPPSPHPNQKRRLIASGDGPGGPEPATEAEVSTPTCEAPHPDSQPESRRPPAATRATVPLLLELGCEEIPGSAGRADGGVVFVGEILRGGGEELQ